MNEDIKRGKRQLTLSLLFFILSIITFILMVIMTSGNNLELTIEISLLYTFLQLFFGMGWLFFLFSGLYYYRRGKVKERYSV